MFDPDLSAQIQKLFFKEKINLNQFWAMATLAAKGQLAPSSGKPNREAIKSARRSVETLGNALGFDLLTEANGDDDCDTKLTQAGLEMLGAAMRFFEEVNSIYMAKQNHGRSVRIGSSATLLHWLVLPQIEAIQACTAGFDTSRQPELSFCQIERDQVRSGLATQRLHMAILRGDGDISADSIDEKCSCSGVAMLGEWAQLSDAEYDAWYRSDQNPFRVMKANGHLRLSVKLGSYRYVMGMRPDRWKQVKKDAERDGEKWQSKLKLALCTNHSSLRARLMSLEKDDGLHVSLRTDTWVESAQLALHGKCATVLPSIANLPKLGLQHISNLPALQPEEVLLIFNPSVLRVKLFRQMLHAMAVTLSSALEMAEPQRDVPAK